MFKALILIALLGMAAARPSYLGPIHVVPAAVSHQSLTQYHSHPILTPIISPLVHPVVVGPHLVSGPLIAGGPHPIIGHPGPLLVHG